MRTLETEMLSKTSIGLAWSREKSIICTCSQQSLKRVARAAAHRQREMRLRRRENHSLRRAKPFRNQPITSIWLLYSASAARLVFTSTALSGTFSHPDTPPLKPSGGGILGASSSNGHE